MKAGKGAGVSQGNTEEEDLQVVPVESTSEYRARLAWGDRRPFRPMRDDRGVVAAH